jgi:hypothetical protein
VILVSHFAVFYVYLDAVEMAPVVVVPILARDIAGQALIA